MRWISSLETGFDNIDSQHQEFFEKFGEFLDAYDRGESQAVVLVFFEYLKKYVQEHFQIEERYMTEQHYPNSAEHVAEHRKLMEMVEAFDVRYRQEGFTDHLINDIKKVLTDWLLDHIVKTDMELGYYLKP